MSRLFKIPDFMRKNLRNYERKKYFSERGISPAWFDVPPAVTAPLISTSTLGRLERRAKGL